MAGTAQTLEPGEDCPGGHCAELEGHLAQHQADVAATKDHLESLTDRTENLHADIPSLKDTVDSLSSSQQKRDRQLHRMHQQLAAVRSSDKGVAAARDSVSRILEKVDGLADNADDLHESLAKLRNHVQILSHARKVADEATGATGTVGTASATGSAAVAATGPSEEKEEEEEREEEMTPAQRRDYEAWRKLLHDQMEEVQDRVKDADVVDGAMASKEAGNRAVKAYHVAAKALTREVGEKAPRLHRRNRLPEYDQMAREVRTTEEETQWKKFRESERKARSAFVQAKSAMRKRGRKHAFSATGASPYPQALGHRSATGASGTVFQLHDGYSRDRLRAETGQTGIAVGGDTESPDSGPEPGPEDDGLPDRDWDEEADKGGSGTASMPFADAAPRPQRKVTKKKKVPTKAAKKVHRAPAATASAEENDLEPDDDEVRERAKEALQDLLDESRGVKLAHKREKERRRQREQRNLARDTAAAAASPCVGPECGPHGAGHSRKQTRKERERDARVSGALERRLRNTMRKSSNTAVGRAASGVSNVVVDYLKVDKSGVNAAVKAIKRVSNKHHRMPAPPAATAATGATGTSGSGTGSMFGFGHASSQPTGRRLLQAAEEAGPDAAGSGDEAAAAGSSEEAAAGSGSGEEATAATSDSTGTGSGLMSKEEMAAKMADNTEVHDTIQEAAESGPDTEVMEEEAKEQANSVEEVAEDSASQFRDAADQAAEAAMDKVMKGRKQGVTDAARKIAGATGATGATGGADEDGNSKMASSMLGAAADAMGGGEDEDEGEDEEAGEEKKADEGKDEEDEEKEESDKKEGDKKEGDKNEKDDKGDEQEDDDEDPADEKAEEDGEDAGADSAEAAAASEGDDREEEEEQMSPEAKKESESPSEAPAPEEGVDEEGSADEEEKEEEEKQPFPESTGATGMSASTELSGAEMADMEEAQPTDGESLQGTFKDAHADSDPAVEDVFGSTSGQVLDSYVKRNLRGRKYSSATGGADGEEGQGMSAQGTVSSADGGDAKVVVDSQVGTSPTGSAPADPLPDIDEVNADLSRLESENAALEKLRAVEQSWAPLELPDMSSVSDQQARRVVKALQTSLSARVASAKQLLEDAELAQSEARIKAKSLFDQYLAAPAARREKKLALKRRANSAHHDAVVLETYLSLVKKRQRVEVKVADTLKVNGDVGPQEARNMLQKARKILDTAEQSRGGGQMEPLDG